MITRQIKPAIIAMAALLAIAGTADASQDAKIASVPALGGTVFTDDFSAGNGSWKYGNRECAPKDGALRLPFDHRILWATLSGRALHPGNLSEFTMDLRFSFSGDDKRKLVVGWAKPYEWGAMSECKGRMEVAETGEYRLIWDGKTIQENHLTRDEKGRFELILHTRKGMLKVGDHAPVAVESSDFSGHVMVATEGNRAKGSAVLIEEMSIRGAGQSQPWSQQELQANIEEWLTRNLEKSDEWLARLKAEIDSARSDGTYGYYTALRVEPSLVKPGEKVTAVFENAGAGVPGGRAYALADFLRNDGSDRRELKLDWVTGADGRQRAEVFIHPDVPGNWSIVWESPQGTLRRLLGVVTPGYMVVRFHITTHPALVGSILDKNMPRQPRQSYELIHERGLAADFWAPISRMDQDPIEAHVQAARVFLDMQHRYGDGLMPKVEGDACIPGNPERNLFRLPEKIQERTLAWSLKRWSALGFGVPTSIASYTHGHATTRIAQRLGIRAFDALCEWQHWEDGGWEINHTGAPPAPYYIAHDDFRKVGGLGMMSLSQGTTSSVRQYMVFANESHPSLTFMRVGTATDLKRQELNIDRFEAVVDGFYQQAKMHEAPFFFTVGLENFSNIEDWNRPNILGVDYLIKKASAANIVFVQAIGIIDYYDRHYAKQPESWFFWPDYYAGLIKPSSPKPRSLVDRIEVVNDLYHTEHQEGMTLPRYWWDHTVEWNNPEWDIMAHLRDHKSGLIPPDKLTEDNIVPKIVPVSGIRADITQKRSDGGMTFEIRIQADRALPLLPLAVWDIPLQAGSCKETATPDCRFLPILDGTSGNLHGIVECRDVPAGTSICTIQVQGVPREPVQTTVAIGDSIKGRSFLRGDTPHVYLWMTKGKNAKLSLTVPSERKVHVQYNDATQVQPVDGKLEIHLNNEWPPYNPAWCPRIIGMTAKEVEAGSTIHK
jgi:hypothetical protein